MMADTPWMQRVEAVARNHPDRPAVIGTGNNEKMLTYQQLERAVRRTARQLTALDVTVGDVVTLQMPNWWQLPILTLAAWQCGAVVCPVLPGFGVRELTYILNESLSPLLVVPQNFGRQDWPRLVEEVRVEAPNLRRAVFIAGDSDGDDVLMSDVGRTTDLLSAGSSGLDVWAELMFTSGTTGQPKGVVHTHRTLWEALRAHVDGFRLTADDRVFVPSPMAHQTGFLYGMLLALFLETTGVYLPRWNATAAVEAITRYQARFTQAALPFLADLAVEPGEPGLSLFVATGSDIPPAVVRRAIPKVARRVVRAWGSTETGLATGAGLAGAKEKEWTTDGRALRGMTVAVVDSEKRPVPQSTVGHFRVHTPGMFVTYWNRPQWYESAVDAAGFFDTGDLAVLDGEGYIRIMGRARDLINRGGEKIPVVEVEALLLQAPKVAEVSVVGLPDPRLGERACAMVVPKVPDDPPTLAELVHFLEQKGMAKIYWPESLRIVAQLPRTASGKVQKHVLKEMASGLESSVK